MKRRSSAITPLVFACVLAACGGDSEISASTGEPIQTSVPLVTTVPSTTPTSTDLASTAPSSAPGTLASTTTLQATTTSATTGPTVESSTTLQTTTTEGSTSSELPTEICLTRMQEAMNEGIPSDYVEAYYPALAECTGLDDWLAAVEMTNFDPGEDPTEWAANVCALDGPIIRITCQEAIATAQAG